ncbi:E3 SUMO-protein ligase NSE2-like [Stegodyphus dumicola]|uniref:E3 SUMO-protein ligase NSE2-like n=1 Tax=Stegodyphus dumicola TaxID=202533 RepID=UPI0015AFE801|nr:E3 SUMO-protein ligase NSE2-like [Stegodyphus dumicola]
MNSSAAEISTVSLYSESEELNTLSSNVGDALSHCNSLKSDLIEYGADAHSDLLSLKDYMLDFEDIRKNVKALRSAVLRIEPVLSANNEENEIDFENILSKCTAEIPVDENVMSTVNAISGYVHQNNRAASSENEEIQVVRETTENFTDPVTRRIITNPVKSVICNHSYDKSSIEIYLQKKSRCPVTGCVKQLRKEDLIEDLDLKQKLAVKNEKM